MAKKPKSAKSKSHAKHKASAPPPAPARSPSTHYAVLGLEVNADDAAIRASYMNLVRQFPPETHPEKFQVIRQAYDVLKTPESRRQYDRERFHGASYATLKSRAEYLMDHDRVQEAAEYFKKLVDIKPTSPGYGDLAHALLLSGRKKLAGEAFEQALALADGDRQRVALLIDWAHNDPDDDEVIHALLAIATRYPETAPRQIARDLFQHYLHTFQLKKGMAYYRQLLSRRKIPSQTDWEVYLDWLDILLQSHLWEEAKKLASARIKPALAKCSAAPYLDELKATLTDRLTGSDQVDRWRDGAIYADLLLTIEPSHQPWQDVRRKYVDRTLLSDQLARAMIDPQLPSDVLKQAFTFFSRQFIPQASHPYPPVLDDRTDGPGRLGPSQAIEHVSANYPRLYHALRSDWEALAKDLAEGLPLMGALEPSSQ